MLRKRKPSFRYIPISFLSRSLRRSSATSRRVVDAFRRLICTLLFRSKASIRIGVHQPRSFLKAFPLRKVSLHLLCTNFRVFCHSKDLSSYLLTNRPSTLIFIIKHSLKNHTINNLDSQNLHRSFSGYFDLLWEEISIVGVWKTMKCKVQYSFSLERRNSLEKLLPELSSPFQCKSNLYSKKANISNLTYIFYFILE